MIGPDFVGELQTKDLTSLLDTYWLSPNAELFRINDEPTWDLEEAPGDQRKLLTGFRRVPTGLRGAVKPYRYSGTATLVNLRGSEAVVYFKCGKVNAVLCVGPIFSCRGIPQDDP